MADGVKHTRDELAFRFVSGHRGLDFLATLGDRYREPVERLCEPVDLDRWFSAAGLSVAKAATKSDLLAAYRLREAANRVTRAAVAGGVPAASDLHELNSWARRVALAPQANVNLERRWTAEQPVQAALALVAREVVALLTTPERAFIRECAAAPTCSLLYLDRSPAGRRQWCEMRRCGSRAKMTRYRRRQSTARDT